MKKRLAVCRLIYQLAVVGIDSLDTVADGVVSLPNFRLSVSSVNYHVGSREGTRTSASRFQSLFISGACSLHCSPMILDISGLASPGCWATTCA